MNVLVIGSGGREHALAWKLAQSSGVDRLFCAPGNAGTEQLGENVPIKATDLPALLTFAKTNAIDLTVVGPDDPLAAGIVDLFRDNGLRIFGPAKSAARLESSKIFAKELMRANGIPTARAETFERSDDARRFCETAKFPLVIKADGLALGKGVVIAEDIGAAHAAISQMMDEAQFGAAGLRVVIEEFLRGWECSLHALVSGSSYRMFATARDHKRAFDGDEGPNTGGMGAFSPADLWNGDMQAQFEREVMQPLLRAHVQYSGLLFPGLMVTDAGPHVLEFNCRFGDPETQVILPRLKSDLLPLLEATINGSLGDVRIEWDEHAAVTVVLASGGYPNAYETGKPISGIADAAKLRDVHIFHAGTKRQRTEIVTNGGRVLAVTALGKTIAVARDKAYEAAALIHFEGCHYRRDIALSAVAATVAGERRDERLQS